MGLASRLLATARAQSSASGAYRLLQSSPSRHSFTQSPQPSRSFFTVAFRRPTPLLRQSLLRHLPTQPHAAPPSLAQCRRMAQTQALEAALTAHATFVVVTVQPGKEQDVRGVLSSLSGLAKTVAFRAGPDAAFSVTVGVGARVWDGVTGLPWPADLVGPFKEVRGERHVAPSTAGDLVFHIRAERRDLVFEFERLLLGQLGSAVSVVDEVTGFRYFDARDLLGFVDGTANPVGAAVPDVVRVVAEDDHHCAGGSYLVIQKYLHDLDGWNGLKTEQQEAIIGRTKLDNVELPDQPVAAQKPHKQLNTITDKDGTEYDILRDNMPFGSPGRGEYGTFFIGYSRRLWVIEKMLERMFVGDPPGKHDRILDYSKAVTGCMFFVPSAAMLAAIE